MVGGYTPASNSLLETTFVRHTGQGPYLRNAAYVAFTPPFGMLRRVAGGAQDDTSARKNTHVGVSGAGGRDSSGT